jgi:hypothetical protein
MKYVAILVVGMKHWLWFEKEKVEQSEGVFKGVKGWGARGATTDITISTEFIIGRIYSDELQYN